MSTKTFEDLIVWQKAHKYVLARDLRYADIRNLRPLLDEASKLPEAYIRGVERNAAASPKS
ncbi:MAG: hypothetical protein WB586_26275 [Chthoniobacterales bacterium]